MKKKDKQNDIDESGFTMPTRDRASFSTENRDYSQLDGGNAQGNYYDPQSQYNNPNYGGQDFQSQNQYYGGQNSGSQESYSSYSQGSGYHASAQPIPPAASTVPRHAYSDGRIIPSEYKPISAWGYVGYNLLMYIPIVSLVLALIFAFGGTRNINLRNYARAVLIEWVIGVILVVLLVTLGVFAGIKDYKSYHDQYQQKYQNSSDYPDYEEYDNQYDYGNYSDNY